MHDHLPALAPTLFGYAALALSYFGWGSAAARALGLRESHAVALVWLGWAVTLVIFQVLHFAVPLNAFTTGPVFLIGIAFSAPHVAVRARALHYERRGMMRVAGLVLLALAAAAWIASRAMLSPEVYDSGLYHLSSIRWINSFPIVPGLGNLHGRLALNQAFFTYAASLDLAPLFANGSRIANSFLFLLTAATLLARLRPVAARPSLLRDSHPFEHLPSLFALPILGHLALRSPGLSSPTPDFASELLQLVLFVMLARIAGQWAAGENTPIDQTAVMAVLGATAITIKLSNLAFSALVIAVALGFAGRLRGALRVTVPVVVVLVVWMARGYVLSGAPLHPSTIGHVGFDWAVPPDEVAKTATMIRGWARNPGPSWSTALDNWTWLSEWLRRISYERAAVIGPVLLGLCFLLASGVVLALRRARRQWNESIILVPVLAGLVYWFFTAPDPRFAHALFICFAIAAELLFLAFVQPWVARRTFAMMVCAVFAVTHLGLALQAYREGGGGWRVAVAGWQPITRVRLIRRTTASGLVVLVPAEGDRCWDAPLPCTPYFRDDLRERVAGRLESGLAVTSAK